LELKERRKEKGGRRKATLSASSSSWRPVTVLKGEEKEKTGRQRQRKILRKEKKIVHQRRIFFSFSRRLPTRGEKREKKKARARPRKGKGKEEKESFTAGLLSWKKEEEKKKKGRETGRGTRGKEGGGKGGGRCSASSENSAPGGKKKKRVGTRVTRGEEKKRASHPTLPLLAAVRGGKLSATGRRKETSPFKSFPSGRKKKEPTRCHSKGGEGEGGTLVYPPYYP